ncbi:hypothetical protein TcasGA2_TC008365 [Tribolium castaneum]|uniref:A-kinase anchor protein 2 C-terminal domain-containing protein n=1 Tax=Tribolium castaneum TaxID=7070 RepID=D2A1B9_TRICA|nr:PREDICTED: uncharacterized protein LOC107397814 [Tribolium castaneum]EFA02644.1 hypothetical protein TcasGA2_TC008365 [Tribolium castaneum]|eukprot:XP_015834861.1 PREDICTED: uncharacterized protein LOC107397814 [Tribolium castaneum]
MESTGNETLDRIQQEIQETLKREEELRKKYNILNNNDPEVRVNGHQTPSPEPPRAPLTNGTTAPKSSATSSTRRFAPNTSSKGVMQKFLKMRGKLNMVSMRPKMEPQTAWTPDEVFEPARVTIEAGKPIRNGFIPAEEKMKRELQEFQKREEELRKERRKSQPDLMAALEKEAVVETNLKTARSMSMMYSSEDLTEETNSAPTSLKPARSLAELCDASDDELETRGTHSLIMQFENLRSQS